MTRDEVIEELKKAQGVRTQKDLAKELGISSAYLCDIYRGKRDPGQAVLRKLGLKAETTYKRWR